MKGRRTRGGPIIELRKKKKTEPYFECTRQFWLPYYEHWRAERKRRAEEFGDPSWSPYDEKYKVIYEQVDEETLNEFFSSKPQVDAYLNELEESAEEVCRLRNSVPFRSIWITSKKVPYYGEELDNFCDGCREFLELWEDLSRSLDDRKICIECLSTHIYDLGGGIHGIYSTFLDVEKRSDRKRISSDPFTKTEEMDRLNLNIYPTPGKTLWKIYCIKR